MRIIYMLLLFAVPLTCSAQSGQYIIDGYIKKSDSRKWIYLWRYEDGGKPGILDSCLIKNGAFSFKGQVPFVRFALLSIKPVSKWELKNDIKDELNLYIEPGRIRIYALNKIKNGTIKGSPVNDQYTAYRKLLKVPEDIMSEALKTKTDTVAQLKYIIASEQRLAILANYIKTHPDNFPGTVALDQLFEANTMSIHSIDSLFKSLSPGLQRSHAGKMVKIKIDNRLRTAVGSIAPDFTQTDVNGKPVSLKDFSGKYLLIDFWASWCVPCRAENPNLVKAYNRFKTKNFTILSIALEFPKIREPWLNAIEKDGMIWTNVKDDKFFKNDAALAYDITSIPQNVLVDPSGKIIARNLRGDELEKKLIEILND